MSRLFYFVFLILTAVAVTKSFATYQQIVGMEQRQEQVEAGPLEDRLREYELKFDRLRHKSMLLDQDVDTNEKLFYLTRSDHFEEALFLIEYLDERFSRLEFSNLELDELSVEDIGFYIGRLDENLAVVENNLRRIEERAAGKGY